MLFPNSFILTSSHPFLKWFILSIFCFQGFYLSAQILEDKYPPPPPDESLEMVEMVADEYYSPWKQYSKAGLWVVPLASPFQQSPYDKLTYQPVSGTGRIGASLAEWSYINEAGANAGVLTPDGFQVIANAEGLYGLTEKNPANVIIPAQYRQLEFLTREILVGWIGDSSDIWTTKGEHLNRIKYGFKEGNAPRFTVNLPAIQRGGNELNMHGNGRSKGMGFMGPYTRDQDFLAISQLKYYDNFMADTRFIGLYKVENQSRVKVLSKQNQTNGLIPLSDYRDSSSVDSVFLMLVKHQGEYQLLVNQGIQLFRQLPFTFPTKGKSQGRFKGRHMGRVGPLYPSIYYEYQAPKLEIKGAEISLSIAFTEHQASHPQKRRFTYRLQGKRSDYHERLTLVSGNYRNKTETAIYQYQKGNSVALINAYGSTLIPAGTYKNFMIARGSSVLAETLDGKIELLDRSGKEMSKARFMQINKIKVKPGIHRLIASQSGGGMLYTDSLEFMGPFLPRYDIVFLREDQPVFVNKDLEYTLFFDLNENRITDTIPGIVSAPSNARYPDFIPFKLNNRAGYYRSDFSILIPPEYKRVSLNLNHKKGKVHFTFEKKGLTGIMDINGQVVRGPIEGGLPLYLKKNIFIQRREGRKYLLDSLWNPIVDRGFQNFPFRWSMLNNDVRYIPFEEGGKYGILDMAGDIIDEAIHDTLVSNFSLLNQYYAIGKPGQLELIDTRKGYRYPDTYKMIQDFQPYARAQGFPYTYQQNVRRKLKTWIAAVLEGMDGYIYYLLGNGEIVERGELE